jgi:hypothetical protein
MTDGTCNPFGTADGSEEDGVGGFIGGQGLVGEMVAVLVGGALCSPCQYAEVPVGER